MKHTMKIFAFLLLSVGIISCSKNMEIAPDEQKIVSIPSSPDSPQPSTLPGKHKIIELAAE